MGWIAWRAVLVLALLGSASTRLGADRAATSGATGGSYPPSRAPGTVPVVRFRALSLPLRVDSQRGLARVGNGWALRGPTAMLTLDVAAPKQTLASVSFSGILIGTSRVAVEVRRPHGWAAVAAEEPVVERDGPGRFAIGPLQVAGEADLQLRLTVVAGRQRPPGVRPSLRDLRLDALVLAPPSLSAARLPLPSTGPDSPADPQRPVPPRVGSPVVLAPSGLPALGQVAAQEWAPPGISVISRTQWGNPDGEASPRWVPFYQRPFHLIVHHTSTPPGPNGPTGDLNAIWSFHTFDRTWGDIGYNYVIDPEGRIYEGRAGGDTVVGAHTQGYNIGAIGISLIGDYNAAIPPAPMLASLRRLATALANRYGIDVQSAQFQDGLAFRALGGHRDFNQTDCPGQHVYDLLPALRTAIAADVRSAGTVLGSAAFYPAAGKQGVALLRLRNTGTTTWNGRFTLRRLSGALPDAATSYALPETVPGAAATIPLFLPALPSGPAYRSRWRLFDAAGARAGAPFEVTVRALVPGAPTPTPIPTRLPPTPTRTPRPTATHTPIPTRTPHRTSTPRPTRTPIPTRTPRPTATRTPRPTLTPVPTATRHLLTTTPTATPPTLPSSTPTSTAATIPTLTPVPTSTAQAGQGATATPTATTTPLQDGGLGSGGTPSATPTVTPSSFLVPTQIPSPVPGSRGPAAAAGSPLPSHASAALADRGAPGGPSTRWYFAEGSSSKFDRETIALLNPGPRSAYVVATLIRADGRLVSLVGEVPPAGRASLEAGDAAGRGDLLSAIVRSTEPLVAERTISLASPLLEGTAGATVAGQRAPATRWYLPHMQLVKDERERLAILNPNQLPVRALVSAVIKGTLRQLEQIELPAQRAIGIPVPGGATSTTVEVLTPGSPGVIAEQSTLYSGLQGYTAASGLTTLQADGYFPGDSGGTGDAVVLFNPGSGTAQVVLTGMDTAGASLGTIRQTIPAEGQRLFRLSVPAMRGRAVLHLHADRPIAAAFIGSLAPSLERSLAKTYRGSVSAPLALPTTGILFAEGDTRPLLSDPRESLIVSNPGRTTTRVVVTLLGTGSRSTSRQVQVPAGATVRLDLNTWGIYAQHGLLVHASSPIVALRSIDMNERAVRLESAGVAAP